MFKSIRLLLVLLVIALMALCATPAPATAYELFTSQPRESTGIFNDADGDAMDYDVWVYGVTIYADSAANAFVGLYDCDTLAELQSATLYPKDEQGQPTQYLATTVMYEFPRRFSDGVACILSIGVAFVHYGPEPE